LEIESGQVFGYLGPNGAGKTTTIRLLLSLIQPTAGRAEIFGLDCHRQSVEAHRRVAFVPGEANLWPSLTGAETLHLLARVHGEVDEPYRDELVARFDLDTKKKVRAYSKGNRQKVLVIAALMTRAALLVLDEPRSGLDPLMEQAFRHSIGEARDRGQTVQEAPSGAREHPAIRVAYSGGEKLGPLPHLVLGQRCCQLLRRRQGGM
jgi:ABC-2 type transport system ATP-binding protein